MADGSKELLAKAVAEIRRLKAENATLQPGSDVREPIAVVGRACRFPGGADDPEAYWKFLAEGRSAVRPTPADRADGTTGTFGSYLDDTDLFDATFFGISPREAQSLDPQQRLLLELSWHALESGNIRADSLAGRDIGVFVGMSGIDYALKLFSSSNRSRIDPYFGTGSTMSPAAGRLSYFLKLNGPSMVIDTACSSSLVAIHLAVESLRRGECEMALAAGVNRILGPELTINFAQSGLLAADGQCCTFDERAHGYCRGEGGGILVLKRLRDAQAAGDTIFALVLGSAVNQDGGSGGLTVPNGPAQQRVIQRALHVAGITPAQVGYVEAHGTATRLGDPIEVNALAEVFSAGRDAANALRIGSVKTNLGHLEAAAGMASSFKVIEALRHGAIPPHLNFTQPSSHIDWAGGRVRVVRNLEPWQQDSGRRIAGVSGFGFAGTNAHIVFAEPPASATEMVAASNPPRTEVLVLSGRSSDALRAQAVSFAATLESLPERDWTAAAFTSQTGRVALPERAAIAVASAAEAATALRAFGTGAKAPGVASGRAREKIRSAFVFTGQGAQYGGMGRALYAEQPGFREIVDECAERLQGPLGRDLRKIMFAEPSPGSNGGSNGSGSVLEQTRNTAARSELDETLFTQAGLFVIEYALGRLWQAWGVRPEVALGHSVGEYAAACIAGVFDLPDALKLIVARGKLMQERSAAGAMLTVFADEAVVADHVARFAATAAVAAVNGPEIVLVSGATKSIEALESSFAKAQLRSVRMRISHAFHSPLTEPVLSDFGAVAASLQLRRPTVPLISNLTGGFVQDEVTNPDYWVRHLRQSVRFCESMTLLHAQKLDYFIEIGPDPTLLGLDLCFRQVREQAASTAKWLPSLRRGRDDLRSLLDSAGRIWTAGAPVDWTAVHGGRSPRRISLPLYPYQRKRHWIDLPEAAPVTSAPVNTTLTAAAEAPALAAAPNLVSETTATVHALPRDPLAAVQAIISDVSGLEPADLGRHANLLEMGLDSLMFVRAGRMLEKHFHVTISMKQFYDELHRIGPLVDFLTAHGSVSPDATAATAVSPVLPVATGTPIASASAAASLVVARPAIVTPRISTPIDNRMTANFGGLKLDEQPLTAQQREFLRAFTARYVAKTGRSKERTQAWRGELADWKASLQFKRSLKELKYPIISNRAEGSRLWDLDGNEYVDLALGMGVHFLGHGPAYIKQALHRQVDRTVALGPQSDLAGEVARKICQLTGAERVTLAVTGTGAVILAQRLARAVTGRPLIAQFAGAYHGFGSEVLVAATEHGPRPLSPGIPPSVVENSPVLDYGSEDALDWIRAHAGELAAVMVEPVQSRRPGFQPQRFLRRLRRLTAELDIALIFDEMINGFRVHPGGAQAWFGIQADLVTYGKIVGGGLPLSAVAGKARFLDWIDGGFWRFGDESAPKPSTIFTGGTHNRHPLALAAADAALDHLIAEGPALHEAVNQRTERLGKELNAFFEAESVAFRASWFGSQFRLEALGDPFDLELFFYLLTEQGFYTWEQRICCLSTAHTDQEVDRLIAAAREAVRQLRAGGFPVLAGSGAPRRILPLSSVQERLFALCARENAEMPYHLSGVWEMRGSLDPFRLQDAFHEVIRRHESLRTAFGVIGGKPCQYVIEEPRFFLERVESNGRSPAAVLAEFIRPFDLARPPLLRVGYAPLGSDRALLLIDVHHIAADGGSMNIVLKEFASLYDGIRLAPVRQQYRHAIHQLEQLRVGAAYQAQSAYWRDQLGGHLPTLELPTDFPRSGEMDFRGDHWTLVIPPERTRKLEHFARQHGGSLFMVLVSVFGVLLHRLTESEDVIIGLPVAGRPGADSDEVVGMFVNSLPLRLRPRADQPFVDFLRTVQASCIGAYDHADYAFGELIESLKLPRNPDRNPLFDVMFAYENADNRVMRTRELEIRTIDQFEGSGMFDFNVDIIREAGTLNVRFHYATRLFRRDTIERWGEAYSRLIDAALGEPEQGVGRLPLLSPSAIEQVTVGFNDASTPFPVATLVTLWEQAVRMHPDAVALVCGNRRRTFGDVEALSDAVAKRLVDEHGIKPGDRVALLLEASDAMVIAILGVLKARAAYVPIEPANPAERIRMLLADSAARAVLVDGTTLGGDRPGDREVDLGGVAMLTVGALMAPAAAAGSLRQRLTPPSPTDLAYVIYTSGTSGRPKGVLIAHASIANSVQWRMKAYAFGRADVTLQMPSYAFDASLLDLFPTLCAGGRLVLVSAAEKRDLSAQAERIRREHVTNLLLTPSLHALYLQEIGGAMEELRFVCVAGEATTTSLVKRHFERLPRVRLWNEYGPTENSVVTTGGELSPTDETVVVGRPVAGNRVYIIQRNGEFCGVGIPGELVVAGPGLAQGYLNRPELTAAAFGPAPWDSALRIYHTGDLARWRADGTVELLGRRDDQVKLRGYRIELQEVEELLHAQPGVTAAAAKVAPLAGEPQLIAYVSTDSRYDETAIRSAFRRSLPVYMMPAAIVRLPVLPLNGNGKVDRRALPLPTPAGRAAGEPPRGERELLLAEVWTEVLRVERIGRDDDYFALGGDSIRGIQIISRLLPRGWRLDMRWLFRHPTIAGLAPWLENLRDSATAEPLVVAEPAGESPLSAIQSWFFGAFGDHPDHFNQAVWLSAPLRLKVDALMAALRHVVAGHAAFRFRYTRPTGHWTQTCVPGEAAFSCRMVDLRGTADTRAALDALVRSEQVGLNLEHGPLTRAVIVQLDGGDRLFWTAHHLVVDGVSWRILLEDLSNAYAALAAGRTPEPIARTAGFPAWTRRVRDLMAAGQLKDEQAYWLGVTDRPLPRLPYSAGALPGSASALRTVSESITGAVVHELMQGAHRAFLTRGIELFLSALRRAYEQWNPGEDLYVLLEGHGREPALADLDVSRTVGWFTSMYPVRFAPTDSSVDRLIRETKETLRSIPRQGAGFTWIRESGERSPLAARPWPEISFNFLGAFDEPAGSAVFQLDPDRPGDTQDPRHPLLQSLALSGYVSGGDLHWNLEYDSARVPTTAARELMARFLAALREVASCAMAQAQQTPHGLPSPADFTVRGLSLPAFDRMCQRQGWTPDTVEEVYPLSAMQQGLYFEALNAPQSGAYFEQMAFRLNGAIDLAAFTESWRDLAARHAALRTVFVPGEGGADALQVVLRRSELPIGISDLSDRTDAAQRAAIEDFKRGDRAKSFVLDRGPLMRVQLFQLGCEALHVVWSHHHILMDGWCVGILYSDLMVFYSARSGGRAVTLAPTADYRAYVRWCESIDHQATAEFWRAELDGFESLATLPRAVTALAGEHRCRKERFRLEGAAWDQLLALTAASGATPAVLLQTLWAILLARYNQTDDVTFGGIVSGRPEGVPGVESMVGLFINALPVRFRFGRTETIREVLRRCQEQAIERRPHEYFPLAEIQAQVPGHRELFDHLVVLENYPMDEELRGAGGSGPEARLKISEIEGFERTQYDFTLVAVPARGAFELELTYNEAVYSHAQMERVQMHLRQLVGALAASPDSPCLELAGLPEAERRQLEAWNATSASYPASATIVSLFAEQVARFPQRPAATADGVSRTYAQLAADSANLAVKLRSNGVRRGDRVAVWLPRNLDLIVSLLGILQAGGCYVPLDPEYPPERLRFILEDSGARVVVAHSTHRSLFPNLSEVLVDGPAEATVTKHGAEGSAPQPTDVAYIIYTSGSTGKPKGCLISHQNVVRLLRNDRFDFQFGPDDVWIAAHSFCFDFSVWEMYGALLYGGRVVIAPRETVRDIRAFVNLVTDERVTVLNQTPAAFYAFSEEALQGPTHDFSAHLRYVVFGGDRLEPRYLQPWVRRFGVDRPALINMYGITETTVHVTYHRVDAEEVRVADGRSLIGRPLPETQVWVLDEHLRLLPIGVPGELYVGGTGVGLGYLNRPELTAERFIPNPYPAPNAAPGSRLYRTGDVGRWREDGQLEYLGRNDHQVQVRGFRVELGEVESACARQSGVEQAVVLPFEQAPGQVALVAYLVGTSRPSAELRDALAPLLPAYMIPAHFEWVPKIPLTANGKLDRTALPRPGAGAPVQGGDTAPRNATERTLLALWSEVLGVTVRGVRDNFFDLGGHSLKAVRLRARIEEAFHTTVSLREIFAHPTIAELATIVVPTASAEPVVDPELAKLIEGLSPAELEAHLRKLES